MGRIPLARARNQTGGTYARQLRMRRLGPVEDRPLFSLLAFAWLRSAMSLYFGRADCLEVPYPDILS